MYAITAELSKQLPPTYTPIQTGLKEAFQLQGTKSSASTADRAAVMGLWCIQDTADALIQGQHPYPLEQETQAYLINLISSKITEASKDMDSN